MVYFPDSYLDDLQTVSLFSIHGSRRFVKPELD